MMHQCASFTRFIYYPLRCHCVWSESFNETVQKLYCGTALAIEIRSVGKYLHVTL